MLTPKEAKDMGLTMDMRMGLVCAEITLALVENQMAMATPPPTPTWGTAAARALLWEDTWATPKQWRRATKRANKGN